MCGQLLCSRGPHNSGGSFWCTWKTWSYTPWGHSHRLRANTGPTYHFNPARGLRWEIRTLSAFVQQGFPCSIVQLQWGTTGMKWSSGLGSISPSGREAASIPVISECLAIFNEFILIAPYRERKKYNAFLQVGYWGTGKTKRLVQGHKEACGRSGYEPRSQTSALSTPSLTSLNSKPEQ